MSHLTLLSNLKKYNILKGDKLLHDLRCEQCGRLLSREDIEIGEIEIKCYRCNYLNYFSFQSRLLDNIFSAEL